MHRPTRSSSDGGRRILPSSSSLVRLADGASASVARGGALLDCSTGASSGSIRQSQSARTSAKHGRGWPHGAAAYRRQRHRRSWRRPPRHPSRTQRAQTGRWAPRPASFALAAPFSCQSRGTFHPATFGRERVVEEEGGCFAGKNLCLRDGCATEALPSTHRYSSSSAPSPRAALASSTDSFRLTLASVG